MTATSVTVGTSQPMELAGFYSRLLAVPISAQDPPGSEGGGWAQVRTEGLTLNFEFERNYARPVWPTESGGQNPTQHLDIWVDDLEAAVAWAVENGAALADYQPQGDVRVLFDPDGHPFCLFL